MAIVVSRIYEENEYTLTIAGDFFSIMKIQKKRDLISFQFYRNGDISQEPLEYGARLEEDENDKDYWRVYTHVPAFRADQINSGGSYDPLEAVLIALEQDMYL